MHDSALLGIEVLGDDLAVGAERVLGQPARQLLELEFAPLPEVVDLELQVIGRPSAAVSACG